VLVDLPVGEVEAQYSVSIVLIKNSGETELHPGADRHLYPGDHLAILGGPKEIHQVARANQVESGFIRKP
jgi:K+/H+ antiporter YhaU regulatory subunit KhtT